METIVDDRIESSRLRMRAAAEFEWGVVYEFVPHGVSIGGAGLAAVHCDGVAVSVSLPWKATAEMVRDAVIEATGIEPKRVSVKGGPLPHVTVYLVVSEKSGVSIPEQRLELQGGSLRIRQRGK